MKTGFKTKSRDGALIGKKKREIEIEDRFKDNDRDSPGEDTVETIFLQHIEPTSTFHTVKYSESGVLKHIDCKNCENGWRLDSGLPVEDYFLIEHNSEESYLHSFKIQCLKCNAKFENSYKTVK